MLYKVTFSDEAYDGLIKHKKAGAKKIHDKILAMAALLESDPRAAWIGKPERLRHMEKETWSRRITDTHRLVYEIDGFDIFVKSVWGHYDDK